MISAGIMAGADGGYSLQFFCLGFSATMVEKSLRVPSGAGNVWVRDSRMSNRQTALPTRSVERGSSYPDRTSLISCTLNQHVDDCPTTGFDVFLSDG
jgi:hypothetical protein